MEVNTKPVKLQIYYGSTVCILPKRYVGNAHILPEMVNLQMWNKTSLQALGKSKIKVVNPTTKQKFKVDFAIVNKELTSLLSGKAAQKMTVITVNYDKFKVVNAVSLPENDSPDPFKDTPVTLSGKKGVSPVIRSARTLPESCKDAVKAELQRLVDTGMIVPVDEPTDWVREMSVAEKMSDIRICIDPSQQSPQTWTPQATCPRGHPARTVPSVQNFCLRSKSGLSALRTWPPLEPADRVCNSISGTKTDYS